MSENLIQLIYASSTDPGMSQETLLEILEQSRHNNQARNITGMLLYKSGNFLQVIEGEQSVIENLYETITKDARHDGLWLISKRSIKAREFADWSMGFVNLQDLKPDEVPGYTTYLSESFDGKTLGTRPGLAQTFIQVFKENMR